MVHSNVDKPFARECADLKARGTVHDMLPAQYKACETPRKSNQHAVRASDVGRKSITLWPQL